MQRAEWSSSTSPRSPIRRGDIHTWVTGARWSSRGRLIVDPVSTKPGQLQGVRVRVRVRGCVGRGGRGGGLRWPVMVRSWSTMPVAAVLLAGCAAAAAGIFWMCGGDFSYTLDDPYIHLALAENIAIGHYGIDPSESSAPASS